MQAGDGPARGRLRRCVSAFQGAARRASGDHAALTNTHRLQRLAPEVPHAVDLGMQLEELPSKCHRLGIIPPCRPPLQDLG